MRTRFLPLIISGPRSDSRAKARRAGNSVPPSPPRARSGEHGKKKRGNARKVQFSSGQGPKKGRGIAHRLRRKTHIREIDAKKASRRRAARGYDAATTSGRFNGKAGFSKVDSTYTINGARVGVNDQHHRGPAPRRSAKITFTGHHAITRAAYEYMSRGATPEQLAKRPAGFSVNWQRRWPAGRRIAARLLCSEGYLGPAVIDGVTQEVPEQIARTPMSRMKIDEAHPL